MLDGTLKSFTNFFARPSKKDKMPTTTRQKACNACADSKRRCDKEVPRCRRCLDLDVDCVYPEQRKRKRQPSPSAETMPPFLLDGIEDVATGIDWTGLAAPLPADDMMLLGSMPDFNALPPLPIDLSLTTVNQTTSLVESTKDWQGPRSHPWFLADEAWTLHHRDHSVQRDSRGVEIETEGFIHAVEGMLSTWTRKGSNGFIHERLYKREMPTCVQDAFTTMAAYSSRAAATKDIILQIADNRASVLIQNYQNRPPAHAPFLEQVRWHMARVHALFVHLFIRLFDGSVRHRASAEKQIPTLRSWVTQMREAARQCRGQNLHIFDHDSLHDPEREHSVALQLWDVWVITESVRRTSLTADIVVNLYDTMTKGSAECTGVGKFTVRRGLWEADSAVKWLQLSQANLKAPLLASSLYPGSYISEYRFDELDDFARVAWACSAGEEKLRSWEARGGM